MHPGRPLIILSFFDNRWYPILFLIEQVILIFSLVTFLAHCIR